MTMLTISFSASADKEATIKHALGEVPAGSYKILVHPSNIKGLVIVSIVCDTPEAAILVISVIKQLL